MLKGSLQIKNGIYQAVFYTTDQFGKQKTIWKSTGISAVRGNKRRAEQRLSEIREELEAAPLTEDVLFADFAMQWLECEKDKVDPVTFQGYKQYVLKHIIPYFKPKKLTLREIDVNFIEGYYRQWRVEPRAPCGAYFPVVCVKEPLGIRQYSKEPFPCLRKNILPHGLKEFKASKIFLRQGKKRRNNLFIPSIFDEAWGEFCRFKPSRSSIPHCLNMRVQKGGWTAKAV